MQLPDRFTKNVVGAFPDGEKWLRSLPRLIADCERRWNIVLGSPFDLSFNYVAPAVTANGRAVVLKLGVPNPELTSEIQALRLYAGNGTVCLLDSDEEKGVLLMERVMPGQSLLLHDDEDATRIAARTMQKLWRPSPPDRIFPTVEQWAGGLTKLRKRFDSGTGPFPVGLVDMADRLFRDLLSSAAASVLLHGDLHHFNILLADDCWIAIDPKGVVGEPAYEVAALLENPDPRLYTSAAIQRRRLDILTDELNLDKERMLGYGIAHAVLSAWWAYEDSDTDWKSRCACAEVLASLT